jgi:CheY-like chemotaxis protein
MGILAKPVEILLVKDNEGDVILIDEILEEAKIRNILHIAKDGEAAMHFFHGEGKFSGSTLPNLILLDLICQKKMDVKF